MKILTLRVANPREMVEGGNSYMSSVSGTCGGFKGNQSEVDSSGGCKQSAEVCKQRCTLGVVVRIQHVWFALGPHQGLPP